MHTGFCGQPIGPAQRAEPAYTICQRCHSPLRMRMIGAWPPLIVSRAAARRVGRQGARMHARVLVIARAHHCGEGDCMACMGQQISATPTATTRSAWQHVPPPASRGKGFPGIVVLAAGGGLRDAVFGDVGIRVGCPLCGIFGVAIEQPGLQHKEALLMGRVKEGTNKSA